MIENTPNTHPMHKNHDIDTVSPPRVLSCFQMCLGNFQMVVIIWYVRKCGKNAFQQVDVCDDVVG